MAKYPDLRAARHLKPVPAILVLALFVSACAPQFATVEGRDFTAEQVAQIKNGATTREQLLQMFGEPQSKMAAPDGTERWTYSFRKETAGRNIPEGTVGSGALQLELRKGVVTRCQHTQMRMVSTMSGGQRTEAPCGASK
jgi:outer membrane protein assembly factor BamE (lipoprotein component of BamABCDE complex)